MAECFSINVFPAQRGDALLVEYGDSARPNRILIDGGITRTAREHLLAHFDRLGEGGDIEALVVTHIDQDHIQGIVTLLENLPANVSIHRVLFNGEKHLPLEPMGINDALRLAELLEARHASAWQAGTDGAIRVDDDGAPRVLDLPGGMQLTILSPNRDKLFVLATEWKKTLEALGGTDEQVAAAAALEEPGIPGLERFGGDAIDVRALAESDFDEDNAAPNGSSIAFLMEYGGKRFLMLADAHPSLVLDSLRRLSPDAALQVDCVKLAHHGSRKNTSLALAQALVSPAWIVSSNGAQTKHPNLEAIARVLHGSPGPKVLYFNYRTKYNEMWANAALEAAHAFRAEYGDGASAQCIDLLPIPRSDEG